MTAEEQLTELYINPQREGWVRNRPSTSAKGLILLSPEDIDLIANLVVERLKNEELTITNR